MGFKSWIRTWILRHFGSKPFHTHRLIPRRRSVSRFRLEELENRVVPTAISWIANSPSLSWDNPANWSTDTVPTINDTVTISNTVAGTITISGSSDAVQWLNDTSAPLSIASGASLTIAASAATTTFGKNVTVQSGGTLAFGGGASVTLQPNVTLTDSGTLTFTGDAVSLPYAYGATTELLVANGGVMTATTSSFSGANSTNCTTWILVSSGGHLTASNSYFGSSLTQVNLSQGSILNSGDMSNNTFVCPLYLPAADIPDFSGSGNANAQCANIEILGGSLTSGTLALTPIGTSSNLVYIFTGNYSIGATTTLSVAGGIAVQIQPNVTVTDSGTLTFATNDSVSMPYSYGATSELVVANAGVMTATTTSFSGANSTNCTTEIVVSSGGHFTASNSYFGSSLTQVYLSQGSILNSGDMSNNTFVCPLYLPAADIPDFSGSGNANAQCADVEILGGSLTSGTLALTSIGTSSNLVYIFTGNYSIGATTTLSVAGGIAVQIQPNVTVTDSGTLTFATNDSVSMPYSYGATSELVVANAGVMTATTTSFSGANSTNCTTEIVVSSGGHFTASNSYFGSSLTQVYLSQGSILNSGDMSNNTFVCPLYLPAADIPDFSGSGNANAQCADVEILGGSLTSGTLALTPIGTSSNLVYIFTGNYSIGATTTLSVAGGIAVQIQPNVTVTDSGTLTFATNDSVSMPYSYGATSELVVANAGVMTATTTSFSGANSTNCTTEIVVSSGGHFTASNSYFGSSLTQVYLSQGSILNSGDMSNNTFVCPLYLPAADIPDFSGSGNANAQCADVEILGGSLTSGTLALTSIGTSSNLVYIFTGNYSIGATTTLSVAGGIAVQIQPNVTVTDSGTLTFATNDSVSMPYSYGATSELVVANAGVMTATTTSFSGANSTNCTTEIVVSSGGHFTASNSYFGSSLTQVYLSQGSILNSGDMSNNTFVCPLYLPAADIPDFSGSGNANAQCADVEILGGSLTSGTLALTPIGTSSNLVYIFTGNYSIGATTTLSVAGGIAVQIQPNVTVTDSGTLTFATNDSVSMPYSYGATSELVVANAGVMTATTTSFSGANSTNCTTEIVVSSGGHFTASNSYFGSSLTQVYLSQGSILNSGDMSNNTFVCPLYLPAADIPDFSGSGNANAQCANVEILGGSLTSGTLALTSIGTSSNLVYIFTGNYTVSSDTTLTISANLSVQLLANVTLSDNGTTTFATGDTVTFVGSSSTEQIVVGNGGALNATGVNFTHSGSNNTTDLTVNNNGEFTASNDGFSLTTVTMGSGSVDNVQNNSFSSQIVIDSAASGTFALNDFSNIPTSPVNDGILATGNPSGTINLTDNYWGTTVVSQIQAKILDHTLNPTTRPTIVFSPLMSTRPTQTSASPVNPSYSTANQNVVLTANVASPSGIVNEGTVTFTILNGSTQIGNSETASVSNGVATLSGSSLYVLPASTPVGTYTIEAVYNGTTNYSGSSDNTQVLTVSGSAATTTAANAAVTYSLTGSTVNLNASVTSTQGTVNEGTETFTILSGTTVIGSPVTVSVSNSSAQATYTIPAGAQAGTYTIEAVYNGTINFSGSTDTTHTLTINPEATSTAASSTSATFALASQTVNLSASILGAVDPVNEGTETFTILNGSTVIGNPVSVGVANGSASTNFDLPGDTGGGEYTIQAVYSDALGNFLSASDTSHTLVINAASTSTTATSSSANYSDSPQTVPLSAIVTSPAGTVNEGTVTFRVYNGGSTEIGGPATATVSSGAAFANYTLPAGTGIGTYRIEAVYNGTANFGESSDVFNHVLIVSGDSTTTTASNAAATFSLGSQSVGLSATVTSATGTVNVGTVTFTILSGTTVIGSPPTVNVVSGTASTNYTLPTATAGGIYEIQASYSGSGNIQSSADSSHALTISSASTSTSAQNATTNYSASAQSVSLAASVTSPIGTVNEGTETFTVLNGGTVVGNPVTVAVAYGVATANYPLPAGTTAGTDTIEAVYNGTADFASATDTSHTLAVSGEPTITTAGNAAANFSSAAQTVSLTATVSATDPVNAGTVTFTILSGSTVIGNPTTANVASGSVSTNYTLPAGTAGGTYTIQATYSGASELQGSSDSSHSLFVGAVSTTTAAEDANTDYSVAAQTVSLNAMVTSPVGTVNAGTVTFTVLNGSTAIGNPVTVGVNSGFAQASYTLPAGTAAATDTIEALYNGTGSYQGSTDASHTLVINSAPSAAVSVTLDAGSDSGLPDYSGYTNVTAPTFDVQVNQAGTIIVSFDSNPADDQTQTVPAAGTYYFTSPPLAAGAEVTAASFSAGLSGNDQSTLDYTINTTPPQVTAVAPTGTINTRTSQVLVTFSEPIDLNSFAPAAVSLIGPAGSISASQPQLVSGSTYSIGFPAQATQGTYNLTIGTGVKDYAGNALASSYSSSFSIALPDLAVLSTSAPSSAIDGASLSVGWEVANVSTTPTGSTWNDAVYISREQVLDGSAIPLITIASPTAPLAPGSNYSRSETVVIPATLAAGNYNLLFVANADDGQPESDAGTNDVVADPIALSAPDLIVSGVSGPTTGFAGQTVQVSWTDENQGTAAATGPWVDNVYAASNAQGSNPVLLGSFTELGTLAVGGSMPITQEVNLPQNSGVEWLMVTTNATQSVPEGALFNNDTTVATQAIDIAPAPLPDLVVSSITAPANGVLSGTTVPISFVVTNQGQAPTSVPVWQDWVILSQKPNLGQFYQGQLNATGPGGDQILVEQPVVVGVNNPSYLNVGESYQQTANVTLPIDAQGLWYVYVVPDGTGAHHPFSMPEESRTDKLAISSAFSIALSPPPKLAVSAVQAPAQDFSGQPMTVSWTVTNTGTGPTAATSWTDAVYMSASATLDSSATLLGTFLHQGALAVGADYTSDETVTLPVGISGQFYFLVQTDLNGQVFQNGATGNNVAATATAKTVNLTPPPDLTVSSVTWPSTVVAGHQFTFSYTVSNNGIQGGGSTPNTTWNDALYLSPTPTYNSTTALSLGEQTHQGSLAAGASYTNTVTTTFPNGLAGAYYLIVDTDSGNVVFELDKTNNWLASTNPTQASLAPADLVVSSVTAPAAALPGTGVQVNWTVTNQGSNDTGVSEWQDSVYVDSGSTLDGNAILLGTFTHYGLLAGGSSYTQSQLVTLPIDLLGEYNLFVVTDSSNQVYEGNNSNNTSTPVPIAIDLQVQGQQADVADLEVESVTSSPVSNGNVTVNWTVENVGTGTTNSSYWNDDVWMSTNPTLGSGGTEVYLGAVQHTNPLAAGASYSASASYSVPETLVSGNYYFIVDTNQTQTPPGDPDGAGNQLVYESNLGNNESATSSSTSASPAPLAELNVSAVTAPNTAMSGGQLAVGWTVTNTGAGTGTVPITDSVYLSYGQVLDLSTARYLGSVTYTGGLASGANYTQNATLTLPSGLAGTFYVFVVTNSSRTVQVENTNNNTAYDAQTVQIQLAPPADLVAGAVTIPASAIAGQDITISYQVTNTGGNPANGSWTDALYLSSTPVWSIGDPLLGQVSQSRDLAPGQGYTGTLTAQLPGVAPGNYYVILRTNILDNFPETNLTNNESVSSTQVAIDALPLTLGVAANGSLSQGQSAYYKVSVSAGQTLQVAFTSQESTAYNELYVSFGTMPTRTQYDYRYTDSFAANQSITIPTTQAGTYYILAYGDTVPSSPESDSVTASIIPFSIQSVAPSQVGDGPVTVQIDGAQFNFGTTFELKNAAGTVIDASRVLVQNSATAFATFDLTGQALGSYTIVAMESGQSPFTWQSPIAVVPATTNNSVQINLVVPQAVLVGTSGTVTVTYDNPGNTDLPSPLILLSGNNVLFQVPGQSGYTSSSLQLFGYNPSGPFGTLQPGFQGSMTIPFKPATVGAGQASTFTLESLENPAEPLPWAAFAANDVPINTSPQEWAAQVSQAESLMGGTWGSVVSSLDADSVQLLENASDQANPNAADSLYNFDALLQYVVGVYGSTNPASQTPSLPVVGSQGEVTLYNGNVNASGNPVPLNSSDPTFVLIPGFNGYQTDFANLAAAIASDTNSFPNGQVNVLIATWQGATAGPSLEGITVPWMAALHVDTAGVNLGNLLDQLEQQGEIAFDSTTVVGEGLGNDVGNEAAVIAGGLENAIVLNPASALGGYLPTDFTQYYQNSIAYETSSLFGLQQSIATSNQTLATGDLNDPILQQAFGASWLTAQILSGYDSVLNPNSSAASNNVPPSNNPALLPGPAGLLVSSSHVLQIISHDPNNIIGPQGAGTNGMVPLTSPLPYTIQFSNVSPTQAPAQQVVIKQNIDPPNLDWGSFRLTSFGFNGQTYSIPADSSYYQTTIDFSGYDVEFTATIDESTGVATWTFTTIDPTTGQVPLNPTIGLLPVVTSAGTSTNIGEGFVSYTIEANPVDQTGTVISAQAAVDFDTQSPLDTPEIFNMVDAGTGLTSTVAALPAVESSSQFTVNWSGSEASTGSGVKNYTVYVSDNGGPYTVWLANTTLTTAAFSGQNGHSYSFYSVATDNVGNVQSSDGTAQATTAVDSTLPTSTVASLPQFSPNSFALAWSGSNSNGIGIATYDIDVSEDGGVYTPLLTDTTSTSYSFTGATGHTYAFYSVATDLDGNVQPTPTSAQATTTIAPPSITGLSPSDGPTTGGTSVVITGTHLQNATAVMFGSQAAAIETDTSTQIVVESPSGSLGTVDVTVITSAGTSSLTSADQFTYQVPPADPATSIVSLSSSTVSAGSALTVTLQAKDSAGNDLPVGGANVVFSLGSTTGGQGTFSAVTDNQNGTYTALLTSTTSGSNTIIARIDNVPLTTIAPAITVQPGPVSLTLSTVSVSTNTINLSGTSTVTLQAKDALGNNETSGGLSVAFALASGLGGQGTFSSVADNHNGTYTATFTGTILGSNTITATIGGESVTSGSPTITMTTASVSLANSIVTVSQGTVSSGSAITVLLLARDQNDSELATGGLNVVFTLGSGTGQGIVSAVTDNGNGTYSATFQGTLAGTNTISATINGQPITSTPSSIAITPGSLDLADSSLTLSASTIELGGFATATFEARDASGNLEPSNSYSVAFALGTGTAGGALSSTSSNGNGLYTATYSTGKIDGSNTITAFVDGSPIDSPLSISVLGTVSSTSKSTLKLSSSSIASAHSTTVTLQVKDAKENSEPAGGLNVAFKLASAKGGQGTFSAVTDNGNGFYTATFTGTLAGSNSIIATINGTKVTSTAPIKVTAGPLDLANSLLTVSSSSLTAGGTATVTLQPRDAAGNTVAASLSSVQFAFGTGSNQGAFGKSKLNSNGTITIPFTSKVAGSYTLTATIGGALVTSAEPRITVVPGKADAAKSQVNLPSNLVQSGDTITITLQAVDLYGNPETTGGLEVAFALASSSGGQGTFGPTVDNRNGTYTATFKGTSTGTNSIIAIIGGIKQTSTAKAITVSA